MRGSSKVRVGLSVLNVDVMEHMEGQMSLRTKKKYDQFVWNEFIVYVGTV